jgi:hypothetical protein
MGSILEFTQGPLVRHTTKQVVSELFDAQGRSVSGSRSLTITTTNDAPFVQQYTGRLVENKQKFDSLKGTDPEGLPLVFELLCQPGKGFLDLLNATKGSFVFTPFPDMYGSDTFAFKATDSLGLESALQVKDDTHRACKRYIHTLRTLTPFALV